MQVNPIDGVRTQFIVNTGDSTRDEKLVLSFENGHLSTKDEGLSYRHAVSWLPSTTATTSIMRASGSSLMMNNQSTGLGHL